MPYNIDNSISNEPYYVVHKAESDKAKPRPIVKHRNEKSRIKPVAAIKRIPRLCRSR